MGQPLSRPRKEKGDDLCSDRTVCRNRRRQEVFGRVCHGNQTGSSPWGFVVTDVYGCCGYTAYTGNIKISNNTIQCVADGNNCLLLVGKGTVASGNTITATGSATGINVADSSAKVTNNTINIGNGAGIMLQPFVDAVTVASNTLSGTGRFGISAGTPPRAGGEIYNNAITGFAIPIDAPGARGGRGR